MRVGERSPLNRDVLRPGRITGGGFGLNDDGGKGIFVDVPDDREEIVRLSLTNVAVTGVGDHGIHVRDCDLENCGAGGAQVTEVRQ